MKGIYRIIISVWGAMLLNSCFSLDQEPYKEPIHKNTFASPRDAQYWVNGMYNSLRSNIYGKPMYASDFQADFLNATRHSVGSDAVLNLHNWNLLTSSNETLASIWIRYFAAIRNINIGIDGIPNITIASGNVTATTEVKHNLGELYLARAYYYTYLVTHFCPAYSETSPYGLPILDHFIEADFPPRSSVKQTYDFILSDIAKAEQRLNDVTGRAGKTTFSKDAVAALKARVLLYKGDWQGAYTAALSVINNSAYSLVSQKADLQKMWNEDSNNESITMLFASFDESEREMPKEANSEYLGEDSWMQEYNASVVPTQAFVDLFDSSDWRKETYIKQLYFTYSGTRYNNIYLVTKYPDNNQLKYSPGSDATYMHKPKVFRVAEQYLIAAEAAYQLGQTANAQTYLNRLRRSRGLTTDVTATGSALFTEIQNERNRELAFEGFRLADIKRWNLGVVRGTPQNMDIIITTPAADYYQLNIAPGNNKLTWAIPEVNINYENGKWTQNPGW